MIELHNNKNSLDDGYLLHWYEIRKIIGRGGFGITYLAHDNNLDRDVAIKEFMPEEFATRQSDSTVHPKTGEQRELYNWGLERFIAEARTLAKFNHPNIVRVLSVFEENNTAYMVMEYARGQDLSKIYKKEPRFTEEQLLDTFIPILDGLSLVHNAGFIHRDIKPANIYICDNNSPLLLDFGSARQSISGKTRALTSLVTFGFAPFEQYNEGSGKQGPWTDIYSLGASIYVGITGKKPPDALFRGGSFLEKGIDTYEPVSMLAQGKYSENFLLAVDKALMFKIEERPANILNWADMLLGKKQAPPLPDYLLNPPQAEEETELIWTDAELGYNTEISRGTQSGTQGLVNAHGKRNTEYTDATVIRSVNKSNPAMPEPVLPVSDLENKISKPTSYLKKLHIPLVSAGILIVFSIVFLGWMYSDSLQNEDAGKIPALQPQKKIAKLQENRLSPEDQKKTKYHQLLSKAQQLYKQKKYVSPAENNAHFFYQQLLKLDADNKAAKEGIKNIEDQLLKLAYGAYENGKDETSLKYLAQLKQIHSESLDAKLLWDKINAKQVQNAKIVAWLNKADLHIKNKRYTSPKYNNAFTVYNQVLQHEPDNRQALRGLENIKKHYSALFNKHIITSNIAGAERDIRIMQRISASPAVIKDMQIRLKKLQQKKPEKMVKTVKKNAVKPLNIQQASQLIGRFKSDLQAGNKNKIEQISQFVPGRKQFLKQFLGQYKKYTVVVSNLRLIAKENKARAQIELTDLVDIDGKKITPGNWSRFDIVVRYDRNNQLKVYW